MAAAFSCDVLSLFIFNSVHLLLLVLLSSVLSSAVAQGGNISLGTTMDYDGPAWTSPSGDFAFGFYPIQPATDTFLLGIWFAKIPEKTLVWNAGNGLIVRRGSRVQLRADGRLILNSHTGETVWKSEDQGLVKVAYAAMLDTGNFVLSSSTSVFGWQSFSFPVDTVLPTQEMKKGVVLSSRRRPSDYSIGRFQLSLRENGDFCHYTVNLPTMYSYDAFCDIKSGLKIVFNGTGGTLLIQTTEGDRDVVLSNLPLPESFYQRATLDPDGVLRLYVYPKEGSASARWPALTWTVADFFPNNLCRDVYVEIGSGPCGFNSYCSLNDSYPICKCPPGFSPVDPADISEGCRANYVGGGSNDDGLPLEVGDTFHMEQIANVDWPRCDYELLQEVDEGQCSSSCLEDIFCAVAIHRNNTCWKKRMPLSNGRVDDTLGIKAMIKVARTGLSSPPGTQQADKNSLSSSSASRVIAWALLGLSVFFNLTLLVALAVLCLCSTRGMKLLQLQGREPDAKLYGTFHHIRSFSFREMEEATGNFQKELGKGSFGVVYKGMLEFGGGPTHVAIKMLRGLSEEGEEEFQMEVRAIGQTRHRNLVRLLGFCDEGSHRLLVYELMSNGSLSDYLFAGGDKQRPPWDRRIQIALGVARGLAYLHDECSVQIIHCDIKPQNVLLDSDHTARIADFGLAKLLYGNRTRTETAIRGTKGYVAPEWFKSTPVTSKVDVYSYGVLLLEIACCRRNVPPNDPEAVEPLLVDLAYELYRENRLSFLEPEEDGELSDMRRLEKLVAVALWCIHEEGAYHVGGRSGGLPSPRLEHHHHAFSLVISSPP